MKRMLLHICCAPCSPYVIDLLSQEFLLTLFFYDPNIQPEEEYLFRAGEMRRYAELKGIAMIEGEYDTDTWNRTVAGYENEREGGKRCERCFAVRLEKTAELAEKRGDDLFTTVLTVSPRKNSDLINRVGREIARQRKVAFYEANFKKRNGFVKSVALAKQYGLKRQNYCGCLYSKKIEDLKLETGNWKLGKARTSSPLAGED